MKRVHQRWHLALWLIVMPATVAVVIAALMLRPSQPVEPAPTAPTAREVAP